MRSLALGAGYNRSMTIYSWNMLFRNAELDRAFAFIAEGAFDCLCLQEVPAHFLERLKTLPYHVAASIDVVRLLPQGEEPNYVVTLSRHPIVSSRAIPFPDYWPLLPWRARLFVRILGPVGFSKIKGRGGQYVDIDTPRGIVRVFNLHLVLANPGWRLAEFERAMQERDPATPTIVCGDFNILESLHITPLNWMFGGRIGDGLLHRRERIHIEQRFIEHALTNTLRGHMTHPFTRSQLDHILVSPHFTLTDAAVIVDAHGSDHRPIRAVVA